MDHRGLRLALITSFVLHAAALGAVALRPAAPPPPGRAQELPESWGGDTFEVDEVLGRGASKSEPAPKVAPASKAEPTPIPTRAPAPVPNSEPPADPDPAPTGEPKPAVSAKPAPKAPSTAKPPASASTAKASTQADGGAASAALGSGDGGARYGAEGLPPGVRRLAKAFTRAVTAATNRDPFWDEQALGSVGSVGSARLEIDLDADGHITATNTGKDELPPPLRRLVDRTLLLLRTGRFALSVPGLSAGKEVFRIEVTLGRGAATEDYENPSDTVSLGFDPPSQSAPGRAYFLHASGLRFEAKVTLESSTATGG